MKLCIDCRYYKGPTSGTNADELALCSWRNNKVISLVTGASSVPPLTVCRLLRGRVQYEGVQLCGPDGIWFEARQ